MSFRPIEERELSNIGKDVLDAVAMIKNDFGGVLTHDSGHTKTRPTWIYTFPKYSNAQVALGMNKAKVTMYLRSKALGGKRLLDMTGDLFTLEKSYPDPDGHPAASLRSPEHAPFLNPTRDVPLLMIQPQAGRLKEILNLYLAKSVGGISGAESKPLSNSVHEVEKTRRKRPAMTEAQLLEQLDRNAQTGAAGELLVVLDELKRLSDCGCPEPEKFVRRIALDDVGRGYDIASTWPGEERCIEVKSTTRAGSDFFLTENEIQVLASLEEQAWLYRVVIDGDGRGSVNARLRNPMNVISPEQLVPVIWRVASDVLTTVEAVS
jgi:hypothetical protein